MKTVLREAGGYAIASLFALCVDVVLLWILVGFLSMNYLLAATISFICGASFAYILSIGFVFQHHRLRNRRAEFTGFVLLGVPALAINAGVITLAIRYFGVHYLLAKGMATSATFSWNFLVSRQLLFVRK